MTHFCFGCKKERLDFNNKTCIHCNCEYFIKGEKLQIKNEHSICSCGCDEFDYKQGADDLSKGVTRTYMCNNCKSEIVIYNGKEI